MQPQALAHSFLILDILKRIPRRGYTSSTHLAEQLESAGYVLTRRTLQRWLDAIVQQYPIECDTRSKPYGYRWMDTAQGLNLPLLTATEALLLQLARSEVGQILPASALKSLAPLFESAHRQLDAPTVAPEEKRWLQKVRRIPESLPLQVPRISTSVFETVSEALYHECSLHLHYRNARSKLREATVYPLAIVQQSNRLYLVCRFDGYDNERILALPRIRQARLGTAFTYPHNFKLDAYIKGRPLWHSARPDGALGVSHQPGRRSPLDGIAIVRRPDAGRRRDWLPHNCHFARYRTTASVAAQLG